MYRSFSSSMSSDSDYETPERGPFSAFRYSRRSRRGRSPVRRYRNDYEYPARRKRHNKRWFRQHSTRIFAALMFLGLIVYEVLVLKGPLTSKVPNHSPTSFISPPEPVRVSSSEYQPNIPKTVVESSYAAAGAQKPSSSVSAERSGPDSGSGKSSSPSVDLGSSSHSNKGRSEGEIPPTSPFPKVKASRNDEDSHSTESNDKTGNPVSKLSEHNGDSQLSRVDVAADADAEGASSVKKSRDEPLDEPKRKKTKKSFASIEDSDPDAEHYSRKLKKQEKRKKKGIKSKAEPGSGENFWSWFQESKGNEQDGQTKKPNCPKDNKRLCLMVYKYLRKYKIRSVYDVSCAGNIEWMYPILQKIGNELWGFKYYCSLPRSQESDDVRDKLEKLSFVEIDDSMWWRSGFKRDIELLFAWDHLPHVPYGRVWNFFVKAKTYKVKYLLFDNYPGILNDPSPERNYLNVRKHPFRFPAAKEVVQDVNEPGETAKRQLLFYESNDLPENLK